MRVVNSFSELVNSDSYRKTPIIGMTGAASDRSGKRAANKAIRSSGRQWSQDYADALNSTDEDTADKLMTAREPSRRGGNSSTWPKDGKQYMATPTVGDKDAEQVYARAMRK
jgi:predicted ArsR family transcriptional regulator